MNTTSPSETETARIRAVYARREQTIPKDQYSFFKEENLLGHLELQKEIIRMLREFGHSRFETKSILDVGCGRGYWLRQFVQWGARPENLLGVDLVPERIQDAELLSPASLRFLCEDACRIPVEDQAFDLVTQFTVFTSILDSSMKTRLAREMTRILKPGGAVLWYDYFLSNPRNPDVRGVGRREISELFPGFKISLKRLTLAPPIGRAIGPHSPLLYRMLSSMRLLRTHYLGFFEKQ